MASIAARAATQAERHLRSPRFVDLRRQGRIFVALDSAYAEFALDLGRVGLELAGRDPLPTNMRVLETLGAVVWPDQDHLGLRPPDAARRSHLAAAVEPGIRVNGRLELYPRGLDPERALTLAQSALFGSRELTLEELRERVASRYPGFAPLPDGPELDLLLERIGFPLEWDPSLREGAGAYRSHHATQLSSGSSALGLTRLHTVQRRRPRREVSEEIAEAERLAEKLQWSKQNGSFLVLAAEPALLRAAADSLVRAGAERMSANLLFLQAMKEEAAKLEVDWEIVLRADAGKPGSPDWTKLQELVRRAMPAVLGQLRQPDRTILLTDLGLFARYDRMHEIDALRNDTGTPAGPGGLWLLIPGHGASFTPTLCGQAVPITNGSQFETLTREWILNHHRGLAA